MDELRALIYTHKKIVIAVISETWINTDTREFFAEYRIKGYKISVSNRLGKKGGGGSYYKQKADVMMRTFEKKKSGRVMELSPTCHSLCCVYSTCLQELTCICTQLSVLSRYSWWNWYWFLFPLFFKKFSRPQAIRLSRVFRQGASSLQGPCSSRGGGVRLTSRLYQSMLFHHQWQMSGGQSLLHLSYQNIFRK